MGRHDHARMVVGYITTYAINVCHHLRYESPLMTGCTRFNMMWWSLCVWKLDQRRGSPIPFPILHEYSSTLHLKTLLLILCLSCRIKYQ